MKRHIVNAADKASSVKNWQLISLFVFFMLISATTLRQNNVVMGNLREEVLAADKADENIEEPLNKLRTHIFSHMNTDMKQPLNLPSSFNRAVEKATLEAQQTSANGDVYKKAQQICEDPNIVLTLRAQCVQDYLIENIPEGASVDELDIPPKELYIYNFQSPAWSPDIAGFSLVITGLLGVGILSKLVTAFIFSRKQ